ncbi:SCP2 sterol-binding domain-containing protein [Micromonospora cathayae]|uniref:SCP2 sterol-binding domain-containing protein n=1 Tax=Micromonospora cathayae TaxID=3028804 RepID=A0ABY7ZSK5_9ACTN|nr:SCP2 sterol-binding domain-containing protein [Micromonospora sp. HUAS 3]WDZ84929.1 SCP2 sterol-binding domain-containing protein [Micromonospora sp. HUAS 3]
MADAITQFFEELDRRGFEPLLTKTSGTIRFDLHEGARTTHWLVSIDRGRTRADQEERAADSVVRIGPDLFERIITGRESLIAAALRAELSATGDPRLLAQVERIFPGPPDACGPRRVVAKEAR